MSLHLSRRTALRAGGLSAAVATIGRSMGRAGEAAVGEPLILGRLNLAGRRTTTLRSKATSGGPAGAATLVVENLDPTGRGGGLFVHSTGGTCIGTYGQVGGTAISANSNDGLAIAASGRVSFDFAGSVVIPAGQASRRVKLATGNVHFPPGAHVLATLQGDAGPGVAIRHVEVLDPTATPDFEAIEFVLTAASAQDVTVAFWVFYLPESGGGVFLPV